MTVMVNRRTVVEAYCFCREAGRSLHRSCDPATSWTALQAYYNGFKRQAIARLVSALRQALPDLWRDRTPRRDEIRVRMSLWHRLFAKLRAPWQKTWRLPAQEVAFITGALRHLLDILRNIQKPVTTELLSLRGDFLDGEGILESRCPGMAELRRARDLEHFDHDPNHRAVRMSDVFTDHDVFTDAASPLGKRGSGFPA